MQHHCAPVSSLCPCNLVCLFAPIAPGARVHLYGLSYYLQYVNTCAIQYIRIRDFVCAQHLRHHVKPRAGVCATAFAYGSACAHLWRKSTTCSRLVITLSVATIVILHPNCRKHYSFLHEYSLSHPDCSLLLRPRTQRPSLIMTSLSPPTRTQPTRPRTKLLALIKGHTRTTPICLSVRSVSFCSSAVSV